MLAGAGGTAARPGEAAARFARAGTAPRPAAPAEAAVRPLEPPALRPGIGAGPLAGASIARAPFVAGGPVLAALPLVPIAGRRDAPAQEIVEQVPHQPVFPEAGARIVEALLLELPLDVLELAPPRRQRLEAFALLAAFLVLFAQPCPRLVDLGDDGVVLAGAGLARFGQQRPDVLAPQRPGQLRGGVLEGRIAPLGKRLQVAGGGVAPVLRLDDGGVEPLDLGLGG